MASQTKMIIITSDEDVIRQFSHHQTDKIHIIDYDHLKQTPSEQNNDNILTTLARLAELPESVCILFSFRSMKMMAISFFSNQVMIKYRSEHSIPPMKIHPKQTKHRKSSLI